MATLDLDLVVAPDDAVTTVVSLAEMKRHLRIPASITSYDAELGDLLAAGLDKLEGLGGELNRSIRPVTWRRYMSKFPDLRPTHHHHGSAWNLQASPLTGYRSTVRTGEGPILLPLPPMLAVTSININAGVNDASVIDPATYIIKTGALVPEIWPVDRWPTVIAAPRAVSVTYTAGYDDDHPYPPKLKLFIKMLVGHYFENRELTLQERRVLLINRQVDFGAEWLRKALRIPADYEDWGE